jgi:MoaA/NifB/PqqE/SkfB family radical SAM enzyme
MKILDNDAHKTVRSLGYNYDFDKTTGFFARWGYTKDQDPVWSPYGPEIADIEISSASTNDVNKQDDNTLITDGGCKGSCKFCYKSNHSNKTIHMPLHILTQILDKMPATITQIAYGITDVDAHPQLWDILRETRNRDVVPNITVNGKNITDSQCFYLSKYCGAVAVSVNENNKEEAYHTIKRLSQNYGMNQVNIHIVLAEDTIPFIKEVVNDIKTYEGLSKLNALVMLSFKDKSKTKCYSSITQSSYNALIDYCEEQSIKIGFDSCSAHLYKNKIKNHKNYEQLNQYIEPCESGLFSIYINVFGEISPCSFSEGIENSISILENRSILHIWNGKIMSDWRKKLLNNNRKCPIYNIGE